MNDSDFLQEIVETELPDCPDEILAMPLIRYLHHKTRSVVKGSKARGSFGNLYAIYVLVEDYIAVTEHGMAYSAYEGMPFTRAFQRQRELPFGEKLQNHALNHRCNEEFGRYFPNELAGPPIKRNKETGRYWINEQLLTAECAGIEINVAQLILRIINRYVELKRRGFEAFFESLETLASEANVDELDSLIKQQLNPEVDARIFEIVSFGILKFAYHGTTVYLGQSADDIREVELVLYKTGRTNSNDGGIDFIMRPTGRIFQVTEVLDFRKYLLDIDKINRFPINFVVKTQREPEEVLSLIEQGAKKTYTDTTVLQRYLNAFESIITIPTLEKYLSRIIEAGFVEELVQEIILQCKVEFNIPT